MRMIDIQCARCGAMLRVNAELPGCMCQYCGNQIVLNWNAPAQMQRGGNPAQFNSAQFNPSQQNPMHGSDAQSGFAQSNPAQTNAMPTINHPPTQQDDMHKVEHYKKALKMNIIICLLAFVARFIFTNNIIISFVIVVFLFALCLKDAIDVMKHKKMLERNGVQGGNIVGLLVLVIVDLVLWCPFIVWQFFYIMRG